jgi:DNA-binding transcriptional MerR regulator
VNDNEQYLKISDFAKLCGVTKDTLFHYERIGILKPELINDNGYRFYSVKQFFTFDIISILKETGTPLKEIKGYIENLDVNNYIALLTEQHKILEKEQQKIEHMKNVLKNTINLTKRAISETCTEPVLEEHEEQYLLVTGFAQEDNEKQRIIKIYEQYRYCLDSGLSETLTAGFMIKKENLEQKRYNSADCFFCEINHNSESEMFFIKPKGKYAVLHHHGSYDTIADTYERMLDFIQKMSLTIRGNAYVFEMLGFLSVGDPEKYVVKIAIEVE